MLQPSMHAHVVAAQLITAQSWKQPVCPLTAEWIGIWDLHTGLLLCRKE